MEEHALKVGDTVRIETGSLRHQPSEVDVQDRRRVRSLSHLVSGGRPAVVGNLDYFFEQIGGQVPYSVWVKTGASSGLRTASCKGVRGSRVDRRRMARAAAQHRAPSSAARSARGCSACSRWAFWPRPC